MLKCVTAARVITWINLGLWYIEEQNSKCKNVTMINFFIKETVMMKKNAAPVIIYYNHWKVLVLVSFGNTRWLCMWAPGMNLHHLWIFFSRAGYHLIHQGGRWAGSHLLWTMYDRWLCHQTAVNQRRGTVGEVVYLMVTYLQRDISGLWP